MITSSPPQAGANGARAPNSWQSPARPTTTLRQQVDEYLAARGLAMTDLAPYGATVDPHGARLLDDGRVAETGSLTVPMLTPDGGAVTWRRMFGGSEDEPKHLISRESSGAVFAAIPPSMRLEDLATATTVAITESPIKAVAVTKATGIPSLAGNGISWLARRTGDRGHRLHAHAVQLLGGLEGIRQRRPIVVVVADRDVETNPDVRAAEARLVAGSEAVGARAYRARLGDCAPAGCGACQDVNDVLARHGRMPVAVGIMTALVHAAFAEDSIATGISARACVDVILARADEKWLPLSVGDDPADVIAEVRGGGIAVITGPTGSGKSSLAAQIVARHARRWPAVYVSCELPADELAARIVGIEANAAWANVLRGQVCRDAMARALDLRLRILARRDATVEALDRALGLMRAEQDAPLLAVVDYLQILAPAGDDPRAQVAESILALDDVAREHRAVVLVVSQTSRVAARELRSGERVGAGTTDAGAESSAIERAASITIAIGTMPPDESTEDEQSALHIGKSRMGVGDRVLPAEYDGVSGRWRLSGAPMSSDDVRAVADEHREAARATAAARRQKQRDADADSAVLATAESSSRPMSREDLRIGAGIGAPRARAAVARLLAAGRIVEVSKRAPRQTAWLLWTPDRAAKAGIPVVGGDCG